MHSNTSGGTANYHDPAVPPCQRPSPETNRVEPDDDDVLATVLIRMWALATGRRLRRDVPPRELSVTELIDFWADDMNRPAGRHARPCPPDRGASEQRPGTGAGTRPAPKPRPQNPRHFRGQTGGTRRKRPAAA